MPTTIVRFTKEEIDSLNHGGSVKFTGNSGEKFEVMSEQTYEVLRSNRSMFGKERRKIDES